MDLVSDPWLDFLNGWGWNQENIENENLMNFIISPKENQRLERESEENN